MNWRGLVFFAVLMLLVFACAGPLTTDQPPTASLIPTEAFTEAPTIPPTPGVTATTQSPSDGSGIELIGPPAFVNQAQAAIDMLASCDPDALADTDAQLDAVVHSDRSGIDVNRNTFMASDTTAFAPNYPVEAQVFWFAGAMVHDARHRWQSENGITTNWDSLTLEERQEIEHDARGVQLEALKNCLEELPEGSRPQGQGMIDYLAGMQDGSIPCDYCEIEWADRDW